MQLAEYEDVKKAMMAALMEVTGKGLKYCFWQQYNY
jgi:hypothetical protein